MPLEGLCTRQLGAAILDRKIETPLSLFLVSVSLNTSTKDKTMSWRGVSALSFYREARALHTQHAKHTAGNTHRHRRAWGRGLENLALGYASAVLCKYLGLLFFVVTVVSEKKKLKKNYDAPD